MNWQPKQVKLIINSPITSHHIQIEQWFNWIYRQISSKRYTFGVFLMKKRKTFCSNLWIKLTLTNVRFQIFCSYSQNRFIFWNTSKKRCLNFPLQILSVFSQWTLKNWNNSTTILLWEKKLNYFWQSTFSYHKKKVYENIFPNSTVLFSSPLSQYYLRVKFIFALWRQNSWAKTWRSKFCNIFGFVYKKIFWNRSNTAAVIPV